MTPKEYPILYSTPMIQAILDGRKSQTRRIIKDQTPEWQKVNWEYSDLNEIIWIATGQKDDHELRKVLKGFDCPYGQVGDFTWARETFVWDSISSQYLYRADNHCDLPYQNKWQPPIFMPRSACRIVRENIDIRVERVADISEADAIAEGIESMIGFGDFTYWKDYEFKPKGELQSASFMSPIQSYKSLWNSINNVPKLNKKTDTYIVYPFDEQSATNWGNTYRNKPLIVVPNPWVWVVEF